MGVEDWSTDESQNLDLDGSDISRRASPGAPGNELTRKLMAHVKELECKIVSDGVEVDGVSIVNNDGTLTVVDVAIGGDTTDLLTEKIEEIEAAATQAGEDATAAQTAATQAAASAASVETAVTAAATAANAAAEQADIAARAAARAQSGAAMAESAVQAVMSGTNLNWQQTEKATSVAFYPVSETVVEPVVDFILAETPPASGDKGPDNPSKVAGVSSLTVTHCETQGVDETAYTINLGDTYYGGSVNLATGLTAVTKETIVFDGTETFASGGGATYYHYAFNIPKKASTVINTENQVCTHLPLQNNLNDTALHFVCTTTQIHFFVTQATATAFKTWLAQQKAVGTPLVVSYLLANPDTVQISPTAISALAQPDKYTPRLNTVYTDAQAVQVGYVKSPIRSEYELTQAITATEGGE